MSNETTWKHHNGSPSWGRHWRRRQFNNNNNNNKKNVPNTKEETLIKNLNPLLATKVTIFKPSDELKELRSLEPKKKTIKDNNTFSFACLKLGLDIIYKYADKLNDCVWISYTNGPCLLETHLSDSKGIELIKTRPSSGPFLKNRFALNDLFCEVINVKTLNKTRVLFFDYQNSNSELKSIEMLQPEYIFALVNINSSKGDYGDFSRWVLGRINDAGLIDSSWGISKKINDQDQNYLVDKFTWRYIIDKWIGGSIIVAILLRRKGCLPRIGLNDYSIPNELPEEKSELFFSLF